MQTFMPYPSFTSSLACLDDKRLGKQRVEALQIYRALTIEEYGWKNHPIVKMWKGYENSLIDYGNRMIREWIRRGYKNTMEIIPVVAVTKPPWVFDKTVRLSHQSNLIRKDPEFYRPIFGPEVPDNLPYVWPVREVL